MKSKARIGILSLGCPRNLVDSEGILGRLRDKGHSIVDIGKADVALVNTCAFIEDAKKESVEAILELIELKKHGSLKKVIVCGCLVQRYGRELRRQLPEVDAFVGRLALGHEASRFPITPGHYAYLKICEGCINKCSFCAIPKIKGKFSSLSVGSVLGKVEELNRQRISELNIIGQDITGYGIDLYGHAGLASLVKKITKKTRNIGWIRLLYLYPSRVSDELLKVIRDEPRVCKYIDLPIQHINSRILRLMKRGTDKKNIFSLIEKIRKIIPEGALRTSIIAGFPSETEKEFKELLSFIKEVKFERLGAFIYSAEEGTLACGYKGQVRESVKQERLSQIMLLQQEISRENNRKFMGKTLDVLIDEVEDGRYLGRTQYDAPEVDGMVYVNSKKRLNAGVFVKVKISDTLEYDLVGDTR